MLYHIFVRKTQNIIKQRKNEYGENGRNFFPQTDAFFSVLRRCGNFAMSYLTFACEKPPLYVIFNAFIRNQRAHNADHNEHRRGGAYSRDVSTQSTVKTEEWSGSDSRRTNRANHPSKKPLLIGRVLLSGTICSTRERQKNDARLMLAVTDELEPRMDKKKEKKEIAAPCVMTTMTRNIGQDFPKCVNTNRTIHVISAIRACI